MIKILFVCHGNICRSPMAEFVMKDMVRKRGLEEEFEIASAATSTEEIGNPVYPPARRKLAENGIGVSGNELGVSSKHSKRVTSADYDYYDRIICMDHNNIRNIKRIIGDDSDDKLSLMLDYTDRAGDEVADPWYTGNFDATWRDVTEGCEGLLNDLT